MTTKKVRYILGRGCDPIRAGFAKKKFEKEFSKLGVNLNFSTATTQNELIQLLNSKIPFELFFLAPGACNIKKTNPNSRLPGGNLTFDETIILVKKYLPNITIRYLEDVSDFMSIVSDALGLGKFDKDIKKSSDDWPFID